MVADFLSLRSGLTTALVRVGVRCIVSHSYHKPTSTTFGRASPLLRQDNEVAKLGWTIDFEIPVIECRKEKIGSDLVDR